MKCYGRTVIGNHCQEIYETASRDAGRRVRQVKRAGFDAFSAPLGPQVTPVGVVRMTIVNIRPGQNDGISNLPTDGFNQVAL